MPAKLPSPAGLIDTERVRVVLMDGVGAAFARRMPTFNRVCATGIDLELDVGFPTVSLPVQHVLWTGLTQQQTGVLFSNDRITSPRRDSIPSQIGDSRAVSEAYQRIAMSVGFAHVHPAQPKRAPPYWSHLGSWRAWLTPERSADFERVAIQAVGGDTRLAFVHILRADAMAHARGTDSDEYRAAVRWADELLARLIEEDNSAHPHKKARWFVLADHGHRTSGGHGGAEPHIRKVRACISDLPRRTGKIHLVDLSRAIAASLDLKLDLAAAGRPLYAALAAPPSDGATLPRPGATRWLLALLLVIAGLFAAHRAARAWWYYPWWLPVAYLSLLAIETTPTMSTAIIYHSYRESVYWAILPGLAVLAVCTALILRVDTVWRAVTAQLLPALTVTTAMLFLGQDLMPTWTAHASVFLVILYSAAATTAIAVLIVGRDASLTGPPQPFLEEGGR